MNSEDTLAVVDPFSALGKKIKNARIEKIEKQKAKFVNPDGDDDQEEDEMMKEDNIPLLSEIPRSMLYLQLSISMSS